MAAESVAVEEAGKVSLYSAARHFIVSDDAVQVDVRLRLPNVNSGK